MTPQDMNDMDGQAVFWTLAEDFLSREGCTRASMMGFPCLRRDGAFFACVHKDGGSMIVKMSRAQVTATVGAGDAMPFAPAGRVFKEWAAIPLDMHPSWGEHIETAWAFAGAPESP